MQEPHDLRFVPYDGNDRKASEPAINVLRCGDEIYLGLNGRVLAHGTIGTDSYEHLYEGAFSLLDNNIIGPESMKCLTKTLDGMCDDYLRDEYDEMRESA